LCFALQKKRTLSKFLLNLLCCFHLLRFLLLVIFKTIKKIFYFKITKKSVKIFFVSLGKEEVLKKYQEEKVGIPSMRWFLEGCAKTNEGIPTLKYQDFFYIHWFFARNIFSLAQQLSLAAQAARAAFLVLRI